MVHKKSTYRLMYKNYGAEIRKTVWEENNSLRVRRRAEEMAHTKIQEDNSACECDSSDDESLRPSRAVMKHVSVQSQSESHRQRPPSAPADLKKPVSVPRLHFSPEESPRQPKEEVTENGNPADDISEPQKIYLKPPEHEENTRFRDAVDHGQHRGVIRSRSQEREYDLIPAMREESDIRPRSASSSSKARLLRSHRYPYTSQLSRTLKKNYCEGDKKIVYLPVGSGEIVRNIGDQTSFNIHLSKEQVRPTALHASAQRNKEIENLIKRQRKIRLEDWREKSNVERVNNSSVFVEGDRNIFSRSRPKEKLINDEHRIRVFSNFCKHCGGRK